MERRRGRRGRRGSGREGSIRAQREATTCARDEAAAATTNACETILTKEPSQAPMPLRPLADWATIVCEVRGLCWIRASAQPADCAQAMQSHMPLIMALRMQATLPYYGRASHLPNMAELATFPIWQAVCERPLRGYGES